MVSERETVIRWGADDRATASLWTNEPAVWRRLEKAGCEPYRVTKALGGAITGKFFTISRKFITLRRKLVAKQPGRKFGAKRASK